MTHEEQLELWVNGKSVHNDEKDACCPDFSCCHPELKADKATRIKFAKAYRRCDRKTVDTMLVAFMQTIAPADIVRLVMVDEGLQGDIKTEH